jgi:putative DNA primase/helicase
VSIRRTCLDIIAAVGLEQHAKSGEIVVQCPKHDDRRPSLRINSQKDCFKCDPCGKSGNAWELMAFLAECDPENKPAVLAWRNANGLGAENGKGPLGARRIVETYDYRTADGQLLFQVVRYEPKNFAQRRPDGNGGWIYNLHGIERVLFHLPDLLASDPTAFVFIPEGERDVRAIEERGGIATCNAMGAGKWNDQYSESLRGRHCIVLPDADQPGRQHANQVAASLVRHGAATVRVLGIPNVPPKGDVSDFFAAGGTFEQLQDLATKTPLFQSDVARTIDSPGHVNAENDDSAPRPILIRLSDVEPEAVSWIWPGRLALGKPTIICGDPGLGKSNCTLDIASRITRGMAWPDGGRAPIGNVLLLSCEDGLADTIRPRVDAHGGDASRIVAIPGIRQAGVDRHFSLADDLAQLELALDQIENTVLVIIDPLSAYLGTKADSYKDSEIRGVLGPLALLAERRRVGLLCVMHLTKNSQTQAIYRAPGSVAFVAAARTVFCLGKHPDDESRRIVATVKNNLAPPPPSLAFRFAGGAIEWDSAPVNLSAEALLAMPTSVEDRKERKDAEDFLRDLLADGPLWSKDVFKAGEENGFSESTLNRAKTRLEIDATKFGRPGEKGARWYWQLKTTATAAVPVSSVPGHTAPVLTGLVEEEF